MPRPRRDVPERPVSRPPRATMMAKRRVLYVALATLLGFLAFPPADLGPLGFVALVPLHLALRGTRPREAAWIGFGYGLSSSTLLFGWLLHVDAFRVHHLVIFAAYLAFFPTALAPVWSFLADRGSALIVVPSLAVLLDWIRGHAGFAATPWLTIGQTQHANIALLQLASIGGEPLVAFVVLVANVAVAQLVSRVADLKKSAALALASALTAHVVGLSLIGTSDHAGTYAAVAAVQPNFVVGRRREDPFERLDTLTQEAIAKTPQARLVVWPESSAGDLEEGIASIFQARAIVDHGGVPVLLGSSRVGREARGHNSVYLMRPGVPISEPYRKVRLVPFGEYRPRAVPDGVGPSMFDVVPGEARRTFEVDGLTIEPLICFESLFADDVRATRSAAPSIIAVASNDAWFGATAGPELHNLVARFRAVENRRPVVIASNAGPSWIVDADGRVVARTERGRAATASAQVRVDVPPGLYRRGGDTVWMIALAIANVCALAFRPARESGVGAAGDADAGRRVGALAE